MPRTSMSIPAIEFHAIQMPLGPHEESHRYSLLWVIDILARVYRFFLPVDKQHSTLSCNLDHDVLYTLHDLLSPDIWLGCCLCFLSLLGV